MTSALYKLNYCCPFQLSTISLQEHFWSLDETEERVPPQLVIQVWDNDKFSADDFLGTLFSTVQGRRKPKKSEICQRELKSTQIIYWKP